MFRYDQTLFDVYFLTALHVVDSECENNFMYREWQLKIVKLGRDYMIPVGRDQTLSRFAGIQAAL